jgi:hypothetical protein
MSSTIVTRSLIKTEADIDDSVSDADLDVLVTQVNSAIGTCCEREFDSASYTWDLHGTGTARLLAHQWPVTAISSIKIASNWDFDAVTAEETDDYKIDDTHTRHILRSPALGVWSHGSGNVRVACTAGYASIPDDLVKAGVKYAVFLLQDERAQGHGLVSRSEGGVSLTLQKDIPAHVKEMLRPYRRKSL